MPQGTDCLRGSSRCLSLPAQRLPEPRDGLLVLPNTVLDHLGAMLYLPKMTVDLLDHRGGRMSDLPRHRKRGYRSPVLRGLNPSTNVRMPEPLRRDLSGLPTCALGAGINQLPNIGQHRP